MRTTALLVMVPLALAPTLARAQPASTRGAPTHVTSGQAVTRARGFAAARAGQRLLIAWVEDRSPRSPLRTTLLHASGDGLDRDGPDGTLAAHASTAAVAWDGTRGAVVYVIPRIPPPMRDRHRGERVPDATLDPLGPQARSGGDIVLQRVDGNGAAVGRPVTVFSENARAYRVSVALEGAGFVVAWTGGASVDGEIQGTVRALRVDGEGRPRSFASSTGFYGETGDTLYALHDGRTRVVFTGERCARRPGEPPPPPGPTDPSARIELPTRRLMPQEPARELATPPIDCDPLAVHSAELLGDETFGPITSSPALATDALALTPALAVAALGESQGSALVEVQPFAPPAQHPPLVPWTPDRAPPTAPAPRQAPDLTLRERPPEDASVTTSANVLPAPEPPAPSESIHAPVALGASQEGPRAALIALAQGRRQLVLTTRERPGTPPTATLLATLTAPVMDLSVLSGEPAWVLVRTGTWSGPVVFVDTSRPPPAPPAPPAGADATFGQLLLRVVAARAAFTAYENIVCPFAERPEAVTSPHTERMLQSRSRHLARWTSACNSLQNHARRLLRAGADPGLGLNVRQLCEFPGELTVGQPINPTL